MFTSRAEFRLLLRHDNADRRLTPIAWKVGLVDAERRRRLETKAEQIAEWRRRLETTRVEGRTLAEWLRRTEIEWADLVRMAPELAEAPPEVAEQVRHDVKYEGYVARQQAEVERQRRLADKTIPPTFDYGGIRQLRFEAREKLERIRPLNLAQAARISGITPADIALLLAHLQAKSPR